MLLLSLALSALALAEPPPAALCPAYACHPGAAAIAAAFEQAHGIASAIPFVASGPCYHEEGQLDPNTAHYAYAFLDQSEGSFYLGGSFGFFYPADPYAKIDVAEARAREPNLYQKRHLLTLTPSYAFSDMNPGGSGDEIVRYWLREDENFLYEIGFWGLHHRVYCRLKKHL